MAYVSLYHPCALCEKPVDTFHEVVFAGKIEKICNPCFEIVRMGRDMLPRHTYVVHLRFPVEALNAQDAKYKIRKRLHPVDDFTIDAVTDANNVLAQ